MSFSDTVFLFFLALILFGPKKLPGMARQAGRLLAELRRASNEFKSQIETEIAHLETEQKPATPPPSSPPQGTVASLSANTAIADTAPPQLESPISSDTSADRAISDQVSPNQISPDQPNPDQAISDQVISDQVTSANSSPAASPGSVVRDETVAEPSAPTSQESHV
jgi:Sec-independent protein translocase protein TatA